MSKNHAITLVVRHPSGLHARPAAKFVQLAARFPCQITVQKVNSSKPAVNAK
ncbi:MAG: HPr family phosphocarrier protein, partial [Anaerolineales bacterium]